MIYGLERDMRKNHQNGLVFPRAGLSFMRRGNRDREQAIVRNITVVIPAKNEEQRIMECIGAIIPNHLVREVIVVDGGSDDRTKVIAEDLGARVIVHDAPPEKGGGRGGQTRKGVLAARGDVIAVVHADTRVAPDVFHQMLDVLNRNHEVVGGAAGSSFDDESWGMKLVEFLNTMRAVFFKISFGDQIQFFRRIEVVELDLFPDIPLMEDVELSLRLRHLGKTVYLFGTSKVSARRWREKGFGNALMVLFCFFTYLVQRIWKTPDALAMYNRYYGINPGRDT
jgi:glycosyltransferase involved in cell wall biosynthesis